ncbi:uncharacterized protein LOC119553573 [Drosophila subpulchrella]|uniref:uncharacterized protein LOC119553573 n=1 Tax=Drosophila subpulchrella TaxID=1486046 RepID=UPI0018A166B9|nr:uncharacterized protein LOC119553573 [Drosophila subpulchrella]
MRLFFGLLSIFGLTLMFALIISAESSGKSRNREDRFDLENESIESKESDDLIASCESAESAEKYSCRQRKTEYPKRKTFYFAL